LTIEIGLKLFILYLLLGMLFAFEVARRDLWNISWKYNNGYNLEWFVYFSTIGVLMFIYWIPRMIKNYESKRAFARRTLIALIHNKPIPIRRKLL